MDRIRKFLDYSAFGSVLILPIFLTHFRGVAEGLIDLIAILFLLRSTIDSTWDWVRQFWFMVVLLWWGWIVVCTIPFGPLHFGGSDSLLQALAVIRFPIFVAALQYWVLRNTLRRRWLIYVIIGCVAYIILQMLCQVIVGVNFFGQPRYMDGTLTGPYDHPRAAAPLSRLLIPISLVGCNYFVNYYKGIRGNLGALLVLISASAILILAGQRMPLMLFLMGIILSLIWLKALRPLALIMACLIPAMTAATTFISPQSFNHLVIYFIKQMSHFSSSPYGLIYIRAIVMALANPIAGLGYDAFRNSCGDPTYFHGWPPWDATSGNGGGAVICLPHPHNHYLEALINGGIPGLIFFSLMIFVWLKELSIGLNFEAKALNDRIRKSWRVGLFAAIFVHEWPFASSSDFVNMPLGGWFFLLLGIGLAYTWSYKTKILGQRINDVG